MEPDRGKNSGQKDRADVQSLLESEARFGPNEWPVYLRVGHDHCNGIVIDLCTRRGTTVVQSGAYHWRVIDNSPVRFRRSRGLLSLPMPDQNAGLESVNRLKHYLNLRTDEGWLSVLAWLTTALLPCGPYAALFFNGPPGAAKTTATRVLRAGSSDPPMFPFGRCLAMKRIFSLPRTIHGCWHWITCRRCRCGYRDLICGLRRRMTAWSNAASDADEVQLAVCGPVLLNAIECAHA